MGEHRCLPGVMARCPHGDRPVCTYEEGSQCEKDNLAYLPPTIREEWESYKATGLEPEEIRRMQEYMKPFTIQDMDRFREIMGAEKDGRLVVLPVKVGDDVWTNIAMSGWYLRKKDRPYRAKVVYIGLNESEEMGGGIFNVAYGGRACYMLQFSFAEVGKTVFLTKQEAETALREAAENA